MEHKQQVEKQHYDFNQYGFLGRFAAYHYQLREVLALAPQRLLEVGVGDGVFGSYVTSQSNVMYESLDIAPDLKPDILGDVAEIPRPDNCYDVSCIFQVLEHLPYDDVPAAVAELVRVSKKAVVISVPHFGPPVQFMCKIPFIPRIQLAIKIPYPKQHVFNGEHYWELGKKGYSVRRFIKTLEAYGTVTKHFVPFEHQYHHFFVLKLFTQDSSFSPGNTT